MSTNILQAAVVRTADALARTHTEAAMATLVELMTDAEKDADRIKAATEILDRGHGKPLAATIQLPVSKRVVAQLCALDRDELLRIASQPSDPEILDAQEAEFDEKFSDPEPTTAAETSDFNFEAALATLPTFGGSLIDPLLE